MDKALIEKAFEQFMEKELGFIPNPQDSFYHLHKKLWLECANWQREQLEAEIKELKFAYDTSHNADQFLIKTARTELIKELREAGDIIKHWKELYDDTPSIGTIDSRVDDFLAKLDLLEGKK